MRVIVIGAGIIGVCTAYYLKERGCQVTVLDKNHGVAQDASFGNAGVLAAGLAEPWAAPGMPRKLLSQIFRSDSPVVVRPHVNVAQWRWIGHWLGQCNETAYRANRARMYRIASYSKVQRDRFSEQFELQYEQTSGCLQIFRTEHDRELAQAGLATLGDLGAVYQALSSEQCHLREPGLAETACVGGALFAQDAAGNCPLFARTIKDICVDMGVLFGFGHAVTALDAGPRAVTLRVGERNREADAVVVCAGAASAALLSRLGVRIPICPVKGYAATVTIREPTYAPVATVIDQSSRVAMTRLGQRARIAGLLEVGQSDLLLRDAPLRTLIKTALDWFPGAADYGKASYWAGVQGMLADEVPVLGATASSRVFLNVGHGAHGWSMACGAARVVADIMTGHTPEIDLDGLTHARFN
jgi:D-amino-acid dehydrogenase